MSTFNGDASFKASVLATAAAIGSRVPHVKEHERASLNWAGAAPCQIGCSKTGCDHKYYATLLGVPAPLAFAELSLFLELPTRAATRWPSRFVKALPVGVAEESIALVWRELALYLLRDAKHGLLSFATTGEERDTITRIAELFAQGCLDAEQWDQAGKAAHAAYTRSPYANNRMKGPDALRHAGCMAAYSAAHLAWSFKKPAYAREAIEWSAWCSRYRRYAEHMMAIPDSTIRANDQGTVSIGAAFLDTMRWVEASEQGDELGEGERSKAYERYAGKLLNLLSGLAPRTGLRRYFRLPEFLRAA